MTILRCFKAFKEGIDYEDEKKLFRGFESTGRR